MFSLKTLTIQPAEGIKFLLTGKDGAADKMVTIVEYYKKTYNATVTKPRLPCVQYGNKNFVPYVSSASLPSLSCDADYQPRVRQIDAFQLDPHDPVDR